MTDAQIMAGFVALIDAVLHDRRMTRTELAGRMGVTQGRVSHILNGRYMPNLRTMALIARALDRDLTVGLAPPRAAREAGHG